MYIHCICMFPVAGPLLLFIHYDRVTLEVKGGEYISVVCQNNDIAITQLHDGDFSYKTREMVNSDPIVRSIAPVLSSHS